MRCFLGIPLPIEVSSLLLAAGAAVRSSDERWERATWVAEENLHVTLKFLGEIDESQVPALVEAMARAIGGARVAELALTGVSARPSARRARMLWADVADPTGGLESLVGALDRAASLFGVHPETREFRAHVTLCRSRRPGPVSEAALDAATAGLQRSVAVVSDPSCTLFSSRLTSRGAVYTALASWSLRGE